MKKIENLYPEHTETVHEFMTALEYGAGDDWTDLHNRVYSMLAELLRIWSVNNHTSPLWKDVEVMDSVHHVFLYGVDDTSGIVIEVGIGVAGLFLNMNILHPESFLKMKDDFWLKWIELTKFGVFQLENSETFPKEQMKNYPAIFRNKKSTLLQLMRNIIVFPMLNDGSEIDFGQMSITWSPKKYAFADIVTFGTEVFGRMWDLNQQLAKGK